MAGRSEKRGLDVGDFDLMEIPTSLRGSTWNDFKEIKQAKVIANYLSRLHEAVKDGDGLFIIGPSLSGKSYLSAYIAKVFRSYSYTVLFSYASEIQDRIISKDEWYDEGSFLKRCKTVDILIIDGLGNELEGLRGKNQVREIIEYRIKWNKVLIINSHFGSEELDNNYNPGYAAWLVANLIPIQMDKLFTRDPQKKYR